jgi:flavin reductase (DIM6/NTAB) family NADH-FMN oxidoreductase RutF
VGAIERKGQPDYCAALKFNSIAERDSSVAADHQRRCASLRLGPRLCLGVLRAKVINCPWPNCIVAATMMKDLPLSKVYQLLEPGPVVLLTTACKGRANVMTMSWHMMVEFEPPLVACIVSNADYSFAALRATRECVIAIPGLKLTPKVVEVGNCSGRDVDKFERFGLTPVPAACVAPPLVAECFANLECRVADTRLANKYNLFVLEVLKAWTDPAQKNPKTIHHHGCGSFVVDGKLIKLKSRMR